MKNFRQYLNEHLRDPEFTREYEMIAEELALGVQLAMRREQIGLTQQQLAARTAIKQPMIARIEHGQIPTLHTLQRLAAGLDAQIVVSADGIEIISATLVLPSITFLDPASDNKKNGAVKKVGIPKTDARAIAASSSRAIRNSLPRTTAKRRAKKAVKD